MKEKKLTEWFEERLGTETAKTILETDGEVEECIRYKDLMAVLPKLAKDIKFK